MKYRMIATLTALSLVTPSLANAGDERRGLKIGIVDMTRVFAEYHKTKEAEKRLNDDKQLVQKALNERNDRYRQLIEKYQETVAAITDPAISEELRAEKRKTAEEVSAEARSLEREKAEFSRRRQQQLLEQANRVRSALLEEILDVVRERAQLGSYDIVFDRSGLSVGGIPFLLHSRDAVDISSEIVSELNRSQPKATG